MLVGRWLICGVVGDGVDLEEGIKTPKQNIPFGKKLFMVNIFFMGRNFSREETFHHGKFIFHGKKLFIMVNLFFTGRNFSSW